MGAKEIVLKINEIFWNNELTDDELANEILELMDAERETIESDTALNRAYRELNIWSREEMNTGIFLDEVVAILNLSESIA